MRFMIMLASSVVLALPVAMAAQAENWIELPVNQQGVRGWYEIGTVHQQGAWRTVRMRFQAPGQPPNDSWQRIDCSNGAIQTISSFNSNGEPIPASNWTVPVPGSIGAIMASGVCSA